MTTLLRDTRGWVRKKVEETRLLEGTSVTLWDRLAFEGRGGILCADVWDETARVQDDGSVVSELTQRNAGRFMSRTELPLLEGDAITSHDLILRPHGLMATTRAILENRTRQIVHDQDPREDLPSFAGHIGLNGEIPAAMVHRGKEAF